MTAESITIYVWEIYARIMLEGYKILSSIILTILTRK